MHTQQRAAVVLQHAADCYMITLYSYKMYGWNEWLALLIEQQCTQTAHALQYYSTQQIVHDNRTATIKDARLDEWLAWLSFSNAHMQQRTAVVLQRVRSRLVL
jgi:hypothetical protein